MTAVHDTETLPTVAFDPPAAPPRLQIGVVLPHGEVESDPGVMRAYAQTLEALGYDHVLAYEHILGVGTDNRPDFKGPWTAKDPFHEPLVLFTYMAAVTERLGFVTGVLVLPQRQTALIAKQAAQLSLLSGNRFRLGVGIGWNKLEYEALGVPYRERGARYEEQIGLMRRYWTEPVVEFDGRFHRVEGLGINPMPKVSVPLWIGCGNVPAALDRVARLADGWVAGGRTAADARPMLDQLRAACDLHGREWSSLGIEARMILPALKRETWGEVFNGWKEAGCTHISISPARMNLGSVDDQLAFLENFIKNEIDND